MDVAPDRQPQGTRQALLLWGGAVLLAGLGLFLALRRGPPDPALEPRDVGARPFRIDINQADWQALSLIPGLGDGLARDIVADREARGPYARIDDLARVPGVGPRLLERIRPHMVVRGGAP